MSACWRWMRVKLVFEDDALEWIAERALEKDTGAVRCVQF